MTAEEKNKSVWDKVLFWVILAFWIALAGFGFWCLLLVVGASGCIERTVVC